MLVYLDAVMILNFLVDLLLLMAANILSGYPPGIWRSAGGALLGGLYGGTCLLPQLRFLGNGIWRIVFLFLMALLSFGFRKSALRRGAVFLLLSMALGGIASGLAAMDLASLSLCGVILWVLCRFGLRNSDCCRTYLPVQLCWQGRSVSLLALRDTGNTLQDPLTGEQVLVCGSDVGEELFGIDRRAFADPASLIEAGTVEGGRLISYRSVGQPGGLLFAVRLKKAKVGDAVLNPLVAFAPVEIGQGEDYRMLTGGMQVC